MDNCFICILCMYLYKNIVCIYCVFELYPVYVFVTESQHSSGPSLCDYAETLATPGLHSTAQPES